MNRKLIWVMTLNLCLLLSTKLVGQHQHFESPGNQYDCQSCNDANGYYPEDHWDDRPYFDQQYESGYGVMPRRTPIRNVRDRVAGRFAGRFGGQDIEYGRPGNILRAPFIDGKCGDCNWGPFYLSIFAGVSFIDNLDSRFTFDNGVMGQIGARETGFRTEDGVATGGSLGRYFYRQARLEFEYTFRDNSIGDMTEFTFADDLSTPQNNDILVTSVVTPTVGNMQSNSFMWNIVLDMTPRTVGCMNLYGGGGLGVLYVDSDIATASALFDIDDTSLAFQGIVGVNFPVRERLDLYTEYRYLGADSIGVTRSDMAGTTELGSFRFDSHSFVFGMRFLR